MLDKMVDYENIKNGEVISYYPDNHTIVTHRVKEVTPQGFIMQGDANNAQDDFTVTKDHYIGKMILVIPMLGRLPEFLMHPFLWLAMAVIVLLLLISGIYQRRKHQE